MNSLRFLLVHSDARKSERIASEFASANHTVQPAAGLEEASDALTMERFDAVLMESHFTRRGLSDFSTKLRTMSNRGKVSARVPVILISGTLDLATMEQSGVDAVVPEPLDPRAITDTVIRLGQVLSLSPGRQQSAASPMVVIDAAKFNEQVGEDHELMVEIIDLFLEERKRQEPEMRAALQKCEFDKVSRLAHTIKGSLGSLHALKARHHAQELELASKHRQEESSWSLFSALEADLVELEPKLLTLRLGGNL